MQLTEDQMLLVEDAAYNCDARVYPEYSGKGMYGEKCVGFMFGGNPELVGLGIQLSLRDEDVAWAFHEGARTDRMGLGTIVYFPGVQAPEGYQRSMLPDEAA